MKEKFSVYLCVSFSFSPLFVRSLMPAVDSNDIVRYENGEPKNKNQKKKNWNKKILFKLSEILYEVIVPENV